MMLDDELAAEAARAEGRSQIGAGDVELEIADQRLADALPQEAPEEDSEEPEMEPEGALEPSPDGDEKPVSDAKRRPKRARSGKRRHQQVRRRRRR
jgi:hypothetical protein